ncbi:hypothetical protein K3495_g5454 [Podosphaera aphanis]|nr:hypothetical protein K3495_g5454 [Podosphaera aphanis]
MLSSSYEKNTTASECGTQVLLDSNQLSPVSGGACVEAAQSLLGRTARTVQLRTHLFPEEQIVELFDPSIIYESAEEEEILPSITDKQTLEALNTLRLYEEQRGDGCLITHLDDREEVYKRRIQDSKEQRPITDWFT